MDYRGIKINEKALKDQESEWQDLLDTLPNADRDLVVKLVESTREAIASDGKRAEHPVKRLFEIIETAIVYPILGVGKALRYAGIKGNNYGTPFFRVAGKIPSVYINHHRIDMARELLRKTDLSKYKIALIVGYSNQTIFCKNFKKVVGHPPGDEPKAKVESVIADPRVSANTAELVIDTPNIGLDEFWNEMESRGYADIRVFMGNRARLIGVEHFHLLLEKSKYEGRRNRERGEELAHAALDALFLAQFREHKTFRDEMALGYANLANACRLQLSFEDAFKWFREADSYLPRERSENPLLFSRVDLLRASLFWWREDSRSAMGLLCNILPDLRLHGPKSLLARGILLSGEISDYTGHPEQAESFFLEAIELSRFIDDSFVVFSAHFNLTFLYTRLLNATEATRLFEKVRDLHKSVKSEIPSFYLSYLEALICRFSRDLNRAKVLLSEAKDGFVELGLGVHAALVSLELSLIHLDLGEDRQSFFAAAGAIPLISPYGANRDVVIALAVLQEAADRERIDEKAIKKALRYLDLARKGPACLLQKMAT